MAAKARSGPGTLLRDAAGRRPAARAATATTPWLGGGRATRAAGEVPPALPPGAR